MAFWTPTLPKGLAPGIKAAQWIMQWNRDAVLAFHQTRSLSLSLSLLCSLFWPLSLSKSKWWVYSGSEFFMSYCHSFISVNPKKTCSRQGVISALLTYPHTSHHNQSFPHDKCFSCSLTTTYVSTQNEMHLYQSVDTTTNMCLLFLPFSLMRMPLETWKVPFFLPGLCESSWNFRHIWDRQAHTVLEKSKHT